MIRFSSSSGSGATRRASIAVGGAGAGGDALAFLPLILLSQAHIQDSLAVTLRTLLAVHRPPRGASYSPER